MPESWARPNGGFEIVDNESTNLTIVNSKDVERAILQSGDSILLGETEILVEIADADGKGRHSRKNHPRVAACEHTQISGTTARLMICIDLRPVVMFASDLGGNGTDRIVSRLRSRCWSRLLISHFLAT